jgi:ABC-type glycerol-3-phosphate transport system permease component
MNELQIFAFIVLPLCIAAVAGVGLFLTNRKYDKRDRHTPAE